MHRHHQQLSHLHPLPFASSLAGLPQTDLTSDEAGTPSSGGDNGSADLVNILEQALSILDQYHQFEQHQNAATGNDGQTTPETDHDDDDDDADLD